MKIKQKIKQFIINQAINFDKLPWNRKERNFALFWPTFLWCFFAYFGIRIILSQTELDYMNIWEMIIWLTVGTSVLYFAYNNYIAALIIIPLTMFVEDIIRFVTMGEYSVLRLIIESFFILPVEIELYRREHGLSKPKNIKKDMIIGISSGLFFPFVWILAQMVR